MRSTHKPTISDELDSHWKNRPLEAETEAEAQAKLKAIGYWRSFPEYRTSPMHTILPDPTSLVAPKWCLKERDRIVKYLKTGRTYVQWMGFSYCRFKCGVDGR